MTIYLDASALVKRYVQEEGSDVVAAVIGQIVGTSLITRAETVAALAKAVRVGVLNPEGASAARRAFHDDWPQFVRIQLTEAVVERADYLAWEQGLRGYDAVQLASALEWQHHLNETITFATFDRNLWEAADTSGLRLLPDVLPN